MQQLSRIFLSVLFLILSTLALQAQAFSFSSGTKQHVGHRLEKLKDFQGQQASDYLQKKPSHSRKILGELVGNHPLN